MFSMMAVDDKTLRGLHPACKLSIESQPVDTGVELGFAGSMIAGCLIITTDSVTKTLRHDRTNFVQHDTDKPRHNRGMSECCTWTF